MKIALAVFWVLVGVTVVGWLRAESDRYPVRVSVTPRVGMARQNLCVSVIVPRNSDNRILSTTVDCEHFYRSWQEQLNGDGAPYQRRTCVEKLPAGRCAIGVSLYRLDAKAKDGIAVYSDRGQACFIGGEVVC